MFTGLIETTGTIEKLAHKAQSVELTIVADKKDFILEAGASVAVSGVCLTVETAQSGCFMVTAVAETLQRCTLGHISAGARVNLERALSARGRFEGHIVLGHVDGVGKISADCPRGVSLERTIEIPAALIKFIAEKGSIAIDGISLTIAKTAGLAVTVALIPLTLAHTTMPQKRPGDMVNIEIDVMARYIEALLAGRGVLPYAPTGSVIQKTDTSFNATLENFLA